MKEMKDYNKLYEVFNELVVVNDEKEAEEKEKLKLKEKLKKAFEIKSKICENININFIFRNTYNEELFIPFISIKDDKKEIIIFLQKLEEDIILDLSYLIKNIKKEHKNDIMEIGDIFNIFYKFLKNTRNVKSFSFY